ncbi:MAG: hypothetical protein AB7S26_16855 [Sandaracinaceae bacterium]
MRSLGPILIATLAVFAASCSCNSHMLDAGIPIADGGADACLSCAPCDDTVQIRVDVGGANASEVMVTGAALTCEPAGGFVYCYARDIAPGMYQVTISAPGFMDEQLFFEIDPPLDLDDCCACPSTFSRLLMLRPE